MILHNTGGTDPRIAEALNIKLLDISNPGDEPNDGIMFTLDEFFHDQKADAAFKTPSGEIIKASRSFVYVDHMTVPESDASEVIAAAALFHKRKVAIKLKEIELLKDRESHSAFDGEHGAAPAEVAAQVEVRFNPYVKNAFGRDVLVHQATVEHRSSGLFTQEQGTKLYPALTLFEGPVFDLMDSLSLRVKILEADWYPRFDVREWYFDIHQELAAFNGQVPLTDGAEVSFESQYAKCRLEVRVYDQY
jgi:hypothetical protein